MPRKVRLLTELAQLVSEGSHLRAGAIRWNPPGVRIIPLFTRQADIAGYLNLETVNELGDLLFHERTKDILDLFMQEQKTYNGHSALYACVKPREAFGLMELGSPFARKDLQLPIPLPEDDPRLDPMDQLQNRKALTMIITCYRIIEALHSTGVFSGPYHSSASHKYWGIEAEDWHRSYVMIWSYARSEAGTKLKFKSGDTASVPIFITAAELEELRERIPFVSGIKYTQRIENLFMKRPKIPSGYKSAESDPITAVAGANNSNFTRPSRSHSPVHSPTALPSSPTFSPAVEPPTPENMPGQPSASLSTTSAKRAGDLDNEDEPPVKRKVRKVPMESDHSIREWTTPLPDRVPSQARSVQQSESTLAPLPPPPPPAPAPAPAPAPTAPSPPPTTSPLEQDRDRAFNHLYHEFGLVTGSQTMLYTRRLLRSATSLKSMFRILAYAKRSDTAWQARIIDARLWLFDSYGWQISSPAGHAMFRQLDQVRSMDEIIGIVVQSERKFNLR